MAHAMGCILAALCGFVSSWHQLSLAAQILVQNFPQKKHSVRRKI
jgi:hypothetical protein